MIQKSFYFFILIFLLSCSSSNLVDKQVNEFNEVLKQKNVETLKLAIESFDIFLENNFNNNQNEKDKIINFLECYLDKDYISGTWEFNSELDIIAFTEYEDSGLRKEFWHYQFEDSVNTEIIPITVQLKGDKHYELNEDSLLCFQHFGLYNLALKNISNPDSLLIEYSQIIDAIGIMEYEYLIEVLIANLRKHECNIEILKRVIIFEFYYDLVRWNNRQKESSAHNKAYM